MVLPHQETLSEGDTNASSSDRTNAPVRRGFRACRNLTISDLNDQGLRAYFETFRLALLLPRNWYPKDKNQYAIRGHRHAPKTPYPKSPKNATFFTLGTSSSDFDNWIVDRYTGQIGELEINGEKGLRAALLTIWDSDTTLSAISRTTDYATDHLDPPDKFANKRIAARPANDSSAQESEQGETSDDEDRQRHALL